MNADTTIFRTEGISFCIIPAYEQRKNPQPSSRGFPCGSYWAKLEQSSYIGKTWGEEMCSLPGEGLEWWSIFIAYVTHLSSNWGWEGWEKNGLNFMQVIFLLEISLKPSADWVPLTFGNMTFFCSRDCIMILRPALVRSREPILIKYIIYLKVTSR